MYRYSVLNGATTSCGCYHKEVVSKPDSIYSHQLYIMYQNMRTRVNHADKYYPTYKDVKITPLWGSYEPFYHYFIGEYFVNCSLDRIDPNGDYYPKNCRLVEKKDQHYNKGKSVTNTSGVTGVSWFATGNSWTAFYKCTDTGKRKLKSFSANKYGYDEAFNLACMWRKQMIELERQRGTPYTEWYGL